MTPKGGLPDPTDVEAGTPIRLRQYPTQEKRRRDLSEKLVYSPVSQSQHVQWYMIIYTYPPENRRKVFERRAAIDDEPNQALFPPHYKVYDAFDDLSGGRIFVIVYEDGPPKNWSIYWHGTWWGNDLGKFEVIPILPSELTMWHLVHDNRPKYYKADISHFNSQ